MTSDQPSLQELSTLYTNIGEFLDNSPWKTLSGADVFGVVDPESGQTGYCNVLGQGKIVRGLVVHRGARGYDFLDRLANSKLESTEAICLQDCLSVLVSAKADLTSDEVKLIGELGLASRFQRRWPMVRSAEPYLVPSTVSAAECRFLTLCIENCLFVAKQVKSGALTTRTEGPDQVRVLVSVRSTRDVQCWIQNYMVPPCVVPDPLPTVDIDDITRKRIELNRNRAGAWEVDMFPFPGPVLDKARPYYPVGAVIVDSASGFVVTHELIAPGDDMETEIGRVILAAIAQSKCLPTRILFKKERLCQLLSPALATVAIEVEVVEELAGVCEFRDAFLNQIFGINE